MVKMRGTFNRKDPRLMVRSWANRLLRSVGFILGERTGARPLRPTSSACLVEKKSPWMSETAVSVSNVPPDGELATRVKPKRPPNDRYDANPAKRPNEDYDGRRDRIENVLRRLGREYTRRFLSR